MLSGHERAITTVIYNAPDGDLIFSCSKDHIINVWFSHNGERLGTFNGHNGTIWTVDCDSTSTFLVSGSADNTMKLWRISTGELLYTWEFPTAIKRVMFSEDDSKIVMVTEKRMGYEGTVRVFAINREEGNEKKQAREPEIIITPTESKATVAAWSYLDRYIVTGHENGKVAIFDPKSGEQLESNQVHEATISDLQMSPDGTWFTTASKDKTAKIIALEGLSVLKSFSAEVPINSASVIPGKPYLIMGGGQEAMNVTTTSARQGGFEIRLCHKIFEEEITRIKGGFGPCNSLAVHPKGTGYALGGEDGYVRLHHFDPEFWTQKPYGTADADVDNS